MKIKVSIATMAILLCGFITSACHRLLFDTYYDSDEKYDIVGVLNRADPMLNFDGLSPSLHAHMYHIDIVVYSQDNGRSRHGYFVAVKDSEYEVLQELLEKRVRLEYYPLYPYPAMERRIKKDSYRSVRIGLDGKLFYFNDSPIVYGNVTLAK